MIEKFFKEASLCFWSPKTTSATIRPRIAASSDATGLALHGVRHADDALHTTEPDNKLAVLKNVSFPYFIIEVSLDCRTKLKQIVYGRKL